MIQKNNEEKKDNLINNEKEEKSNEDENNKKISILNADFTDKNTIINSPRSIEACLRLGIQTSELIQQNLEEFKISHPDVRSLEPNMLKYRYNAAEKFRIQSINLIKKEREKIIDEANDIKIGDKNDINKNTYKYANMSKTYNTTNSKEKWTAANTTVGDDIDQKMEQIFSEQKKAMMKIKQKQRQDIQALIKSQIDREISEKINYEKERRHKEKEEENFRELERRKNIKERKLKEKERKRVEEINRQLEEQKEKFRLKEEKEQLRHIEMVEAEKQRQEEQKRKKNLEMRKLNQRRKALEEKDKEREDRLRQKQLEHQLYEEELSRQKQKEFLETKRNQERKNQKVLKRQENNKEKIEKDLEQLKNKLKNKEKNTEKLLEKFYEEREKKLNEEKRKNKKRTDHVLKYIKKNEEEQEKNRKEFINKQLKLEQTVSCRALSRDDTNKKMARNQEKKYLHTVQNRKFLEEENNHKKMKMIKRMNSIDNRVKENKIMNDKYNIQRREEGNVRMLERNITIQRLLRVQDYKNKLRMDELDEKERKLNEFKKQREKLAMQRAQASTEVQKQKEEAMLKFDKLARQKKEIEPEMIRELFPGDNELYENIKEMKRLQKEKEENIIKKMDNYEKRNKSMTNNYFYNKRRNVDDENINEGEGVDDDKNKRNEDKKEKEIQNKVEEFKAKEYKEFNKLINEEKVKEEEREKLYENEKDEKKRLEIEKKNKEERELASKNIEKTKNDIDKRIKEYEENIRKEK